jgi:hypothetical protein
VSGARRRRAPRRPVLKERVPGAGTQAPRRIGRAPS